MAYGEENKIRISNNYPHSLMLHISELLKERGITVPDRLSESELLEEFYQKYSKYPAEIKELQAAQQEQVISGFVENKKAPAWRKRAFINASLGKLVGTLKEYEAVELIESLMHIFHWEMEFSANRKWEAAEEDKADFHNFDKPSDSGDRGFERRTRGQIEEKAEKQSGVRRRRIREAGTQEDESVSSSKEREYAGPGRRGSRHNAPGNAGNQPDREAALEGQSADREVLPEYLMIEGLSEEEYRRELAKIEIKHEALMSMAVRRELKRAKKGDATSQCILGNFYAEEKTEHTDYEMAVKWYAFSARQGNFKAKLQMGRLFDSEKLQEKNTKKYGIRYFQELAEEGYPTAQCIMGLKYYFGDGVDKNTAKGVKWLKRAGEQGYAEAQRQLGDIYVIINEKEAEKWYGMAEANGDSLAAKKLKALRDKSKVIEKRSI